MAAERSELVHDCLRVCQGLSHRVGVVCVLSLHGLQNRKVSHHFQGWERSEGNKYLLDGFLNPKEVRCVESVLVKKHGCKEIGWVKFYENIERAVVRNLPSKMTTLKGFQDATEYGATDMMKTIDLFDTNVKSAHAQLFYEAEDVPNTMRES